MFRTGLHWDMGRACVVHPLDNTAAVAVVDSGNAGVAETDFDADAPPPTAAPASVPASPPPPPSFVPF